MKIVCSRQALCDAVSNIQGAVSTSTIPALEGILFSARGEFLRMSGYNLEMGITTAVSAQIHEPGEFVINAHLFYDIVRRLPQDTVTLEIDEKLICTIRCGESEFSVIGLSSQEFPELPVVAGGASLTMPQGILKNMVRQTRFAVSKNDAKPVHTGILFEITDTFIRLVAVDGYRLAIRTEQMPGNLAMTFIVPEKTLSEIIKLLSDSDENEVSLSVGKRHIIFEIGSYVVVSRLLDGDFLDYKAAVPSSGTTVATVSTREMTDCIERMSLIIIDRLKSPVRCIFDEDSIKASCTTGIGSANDKISAAVQGPRVEIGFNNRFLIEALKAAESDQVLMELNGPLSPMIIRPVEGEEFLFLVLPVRLRTD